MFYSPVYYCWDVTIPDDARVYVEDGKYKSYQSLGEFILEDTVITYKKDDLPFVPLRWSVVRNENYGRSSCDLVIGDLKTLEEGTKTVVKAGSIMSDIQFFVKPNSGIVILLTPGVPVLFTMKGSFS